MSDQDHTRAPGRRSHPARLVDPGPDPWFDCGLCGFVFDTAMYDACPRCLDNIRRTAPGEWPQLESEFLELLCTDFGETKH